MKKTALIILVLAMLLAAGEAWAYAVYNHTNHKICILNWYSTGGCRFEVEPHSTYNGEHGAGLKRIWVFYNGKENNWESGELSIPDGGFIRVYEHEVKIYDHKNNQTGSSTIGIQD